MGVEAGRAPRCAGGADDDAAGVLFATTNPPYLDKTNATAIHAALDLDAGGPAYDMGGVGALGRRRRWSPALLRARPAARRRCPTCAPACPAAPTSATAATPRSRSSAATASASDRRGIGARRAPPREFLDRWRVPGEPASPGVGGALRRARLRAAGRAGAVADALEAGRAHAGELDHVIVAGVHARAARRIAARHRRAARGATPTTSRATVGNTGAAHPALLLADVLDRAERRPDDRWS